MTQSLPFARDLLHSPMARAALAVVRQLIEAGFEAYLAGGSVRDLLLGSKPTDFDIVTGATPDEVEELFPHTIPLGKSFGIMVVRWGRYSFEVATFRTERGYRDRRRPDAVGWASVKEDAGRRDFTINALYYQTEEERILDFVNGQRDLEARIIRFVGEPNQRVSEDHLRMLRALRFKNSLGFQYDPATYQAVRRHANEIHHISAERIRDELNLMWADPSRASALRELAEVGLLAIVLPEIDQLRGVPQPREFHKEGDVFEHTVRAIASLPKRSPAFLVWAVLMHDAGKAVTLHYPESAADRIRFNGHRTAGAQLARQVGMRLRMPRVEIETMAWLVEHHMNLVGIDRMREAKRRRYLLDPRFRWLLELHHADVAGTSPRDFSLYKEVRAFYRRYLELWRTEQQRGQPKRLLSGHDLQKELGLEPGPRLGRLLAKIHDAQLEEKITTRSEALALARTLLNRSQ